jgi:hypothetical protein
MLYFAATFIGGSSQICGGLIDTRAIALGIHLDQLAAQ